MQASPPPPSVPFETGEVSVAEWLIPWASIGVESTTRFLLTDRRLVVQCVFTRAGWFAGKKEREMVNLGNWQELLNAKLEELNDPMFGHQPGPVTTLTNLMIGGRPMILVTEQNRPAIDTMLPKISHQRALRLQALAAEADSVAPGSKADERPGAGPAPPEP